ncbi:MAG: S-layer homology domain-containing protein [Bacillota bacterium]|nr:S-layer homology domain-containing protein [Bacillota bacterium]
MNQKKSKNVSYKIIAFMLAFTFMLTIISNTSMANQNLPIYPPMTTYQGLDSIEAMLQNVSFQDIDGHWARMDIIRMAALGIVKGTTQRNFLPENSLTREEALTMVVRAMGFEAEAQKRGQEIMAERGDRVGVLASWAIGFIFLANDLGIISDELLEQLEAGAAAQFATRQEVATWLAYALELEPIYGDNIQYIYTYSDWESTLVENVPYVEAMLANRYMQGMSAQQLQPNGLITRAQMATLLQKVAINFDEKRGIERYRGQAISNQTQTEMLEDGKLTRFMQRVVNTNGELINLAIETRTFNNGESERKDFLTANGDQVGFSRNLLTTGDYISYIIKDGYVLWLEIVEPNVTYIEGTIQVIDQGQNRLVIKSLDNDEHKVIQMSENMYVNINWLPATIFDLLYDQEVVITVDNDVATYINAMVDTGEPGYIEPGSKVRVGKVRAIAANEVTIVSPLGVEATFAVTPGTIITRGNRQISLAEIYIGDNIKLHFDQYDTQYIARLLQETTGPQIHKIYRGAIDFVFGTRSLTLKDAEEYFYGDWLPGGNTISLGIGGKSLFYDEANPISANQLGQSYLGRNAYVVTEKINGVEQISKLLIKSGDSWADTDKVESINWALQHLRLSHSSHQSIGFHEGTIVMANGRLLDYQNIARDSNIFLEAAETSNGLVSAIVMLDKFYHPLLTIYKGKIHDVRRNDAVLRGYSVLDPHSWQLASSTSTNYTWRVQESTAILDAIDADKEPKWISPAEFQHSYYTKEYQGSTIGSGSTVYGQRSAYVVTSEDRAVAMVILDELATNEKTSIGRVQTIDLENKQMVVEWVKDWSDHYQQWVPNTFPLEINLSRALFLKESNPITIDDIKKGDHIYFIRDNQYGLIVVVQ